MNCASSPASHIRQDGVGGEIGFQCEQVFGIAGNRRAQKNIIAASKRTVDRGADLIQNLFLFRQFQKSGIDIVCDQSCVRQTKPDRFGNGAADQTEPYKTAGECFHNVITFHAFHFRIYDSTKREGAQGGRAAAK